MRFTIVMIVLILISISAIQAGSKFYIRNIWTDQPVSDAKIILPDTTIISNDRGSFQINIVQLDSISLTIKKTGYFDYIFNIKDLNSPIIYLTPVENTKSIVCIQSQLTDIPLQLPSSTSFIFINQTDQISKNNIANVLAEQTGIFMKSYGPAGSIQSVSVRGMSPEQTQILFDGIPMNSLQLGSVDMGYYALNNIGSLEIYRGGNALFGGSGSIGGSIDIQPSPLLYDFGYKVSSSFNSLNAFNFDGSVDIPLKNYRQRIFISHANALNDFKAEYNGKKVVLENRDYKQINYGYQNAYAFNRDLSIKGYVSGYKREAGSPQAFINPEKEKENSARSTIKNYMGKIKLDYNTDTYGLIFQGYQRDEQMEYNDTSLVIYYESLHSAHKNKETGVQLRLHYPVFKRVLINGGFESAWQRINSTESGDHSRQRTAGYLLSDFNIYSDYLGIIRFISINGALRYENFSNYGDIFLPGFGFNLQGNIWQLYLTGSKNYRIPTFNELYWQPGGNENLHPEKSLNFETGFEIKSHTSPYLFYNFQTALYQNIVKDQIKWLPDNSSIWTPQNIREVLSRGIELEVSLYDAGDIHKLSCNYRYSISEKHKAESNDDETAGNQLPYL
ncbi:MAG: TonB-dependent receptor, partial [Calditrichaceae bacterium]